MRVISMLHNSKEGFRATEDWEEGIWSKELPHQNATVTHKVRYIRNRNTGHIITSQVNAWNDEVRFLMYVDLVLLPYMTSNNLESLFLWMDNFSVHVKQSVVEYLRSKGIFPGFYPANYTDDIQVCDLIINKLIKQGMRNFRAGEAYDFLQQSRVNFCMMSPEEQSEYLFMPPKPKLHNGLNTLISMFSETGLFQQQKFKESIQECFIFTGAAPIGLDIANGFRTFEMNNNTEHKAPLLLPIIPNDVKIYTVDPVIVDSAERERMENLCDSLSDIFFEGVVPYPDLKDNDVNSDDTALDDCDYYVYEDECEINCP
jgi:hypothetical protein